MHGFAFQVDKLISEIEDHQLLHELSLEDDVTVEELPQLLLLRCQDPSFCHLRLLRLMLRTLPGLLSAFHLHSLRKKLHPTR